MLNQTTELSPKQVANLIEATPSILHQLLCLVDRELLLWRPTPDAWSINQIIGHLLQADRVFMDTIQLIVDQWRPTLTGDDVDAAVAAGNFDQLDTFELIDELDAFRTKHCVPFVCQLGAKQLAKVGVFKETDYYTGGDFSAADYLYEWPYHDYLHLNQINNNLRAYLWPSMSHTMRKALSGDNPPI